MMLTQFNFSYNTNNKKNLSLYGKCEICFYYMHKFIMLWKIDRKKEKLFSYENNAGKVFGSRFIVIDV